MSNEVGTKQQENKMGVMPVNKLLLNMSEIGRAHV